MPYPPAVLFDLDGTLTDPMEGITKSVQIALRRQGIEVADRRTLCPFIGPPLFESFQRFFSLDDERAARAVEDYRAYFSVTGIFENKVYPGIPGLLQRLHDGGTFTAVATLKPAVFARRIVEHFGLLPFLDRVAGSELDGRHTTKGEIVRLALDGLSPAMREGAVMVGDRENDIRGGKENGLHTVGVLFGYGSEAELRAAGADGLAEDAASLEALLRAFPPRREGAAPDTRRGGGEPVKNEDGIADGME